MIFWWRSTVKCDKYFSAASLRHSKSLCSNSASSLSCILLIAHYEVLKGSLVISRERLHGRLHDVGGGDLGVILRTDHLWADF
jgi:hypothetical protein